MPNPKATDGASIEDAQQWAGDQAESAHCQPDESKSEGDAPVLIQIGPLDV